MEHGWCPTSPPRRTPLQIVGRFAVLLDFPGFLILDQPPKCYGTWLVSDQLPWSDTSNQPPKCYGIWGVRPAHLVGHPRTNTKVLWNMGVSTSPPRWTPSNQSPKCYGIWPPHRTRFISVRLCGNDILLGLPLPLFSGPKIPFPGNREVGFRRPRGPRLRCCRARL